MNPFKNLINKISAIFSDKKIFLESYKSPLENTIKRT